MRRMAPEKQVGRSENCGTSQVGRQRGKQGGMTEWGHSRQVRTFARGSAEFGGGTKAGKQGQVLGRRVMGATKVSKEDSDVVRATLKLTRVAL